MKVSDAVVEKIAHAIAKAEGFFAPGSRPARNHNPGDFESDIIGKGVGRDGPYIVYADDETGWRALRTQVHLFFDGSHIYTPDMTIAQVASHYTATDSMPWAKIVADDLKVTTSTRLKEIV